MALNLASQHVQHNDEQYQLAAASALQPIFAPSFGQTDTALARQHDLAQLTGCIVAMAAQHLGADAPVAAERVQHAFASMFSAASLPRLASLSPRDREAELKQLAYICVGRL